MDKPTRRELNQVYYLKREIEHLQSLIDRCGADLRSPQMDGAPAGTGKPGDPTGMSATKIADISVQLEDLQRKCKASQRKVLRYIARMEDSRMRQIVTMRCLELKSWDEIAEALGGHNTAVTCRVAFHREFEK